MTLYKACAIMARNAVPVIFAGRVHQANLAHRRRLSRQHRAEDLRRWRNQVLAEARR